MTSSSSFLTAVLAALSSSWLASASSCALPKAQIDLHGVALPSPAHPITQIGLGIGTQNYTCSSAGNYSSAGAVAVLYDVSCEYGSSSFNNLSSSAYSIWAADSTEFQESSLVDLLHSAASSGSVPVLGDHFFIGVGNGTLSPKWDFSSHALVGDSAAFVVAAKEAGAASPLGSNNAVDWLYLTAVSGRLAREVYRTDTEGGVPPTKCTPGSEPISVKYTSLYYFTGGLVRVNLKGHLKSN